MLPYSHLLNHNPVKTQFEPAWVGTDEDTPDSGITWHIHCVTSLKCFLFLMAVLGFEFKALHQALYHLSYAPSPFCFGYF
jgi:hypothetical protein